MYDRKGNIVDRRELLRVKLKSLAEEARIIRREEQRTWGALRNELHEHRVGVVRRVARETHLAYGFIRGRSLEQMENTSKNPPDMTAVAKMIKKYGPVAPSPASSVVEQRTLTPVA